MRMTCAGAVLAGVVLSMLLFAAPASATDQQRWVTIAARSCPTYDDITANRARNNIMESLEDLGPDTPYGEDGRPLLVDPETERNFQPNCHAISNWAFTLGTGYESKAVPGVWGALSKVTNPFSPTIWTRPFVPLFSSKMIPTGGFIWGAVTIRLTRAQRELAKENNKLWIQGGTPTAPITRPDDYAFGALRCATDNLNGDNVEWIAYPPAAAHVFCFAYYVKPAPKSGTITVVKKVVAPDKERRTFEFTGDISYENEQFDLTAANGDPGQMSFIRAAGRNWSFTEDPDQDQLGELGTLTNITCTSKLGSPYDTDKTSGRTTVSLKQGDDVTCTYTNTFRKPASGLVINKVSSGGVGDFGFTIEGNGITPIDGHATTVEPGRPATVDPANRIADLPAGTYTVHEDLPPDRGGTWAFDHVACTPDDAKGERHGQSVEITVDNGTVCTVYNRFTPAGEITLNKITLGGTGTARFQVTQAFGDDPQEREVVATTTQPGESVRATGDPLSELPMGTYWIQETIGGPDRWEVASLECDGIPVSAIAGRVEIDLTPDKPTRDCTAVNRRIEDIVPPQPPQPPTPPTGPPTEDGPDGGVAGQVAEPVAELRVTKRVVPRRVRIGGRVRYLIAIVNRGPDAAKNVTLTEPGISPRSGRLPLRPSKGTCRNRPPRYCDFGTLKPGQRVTVRVAVKTRKTGRFVNRVAVNSSTDQRTMRRKRARASVLVRPLAPPSFTG